MEVAAVSMRGSGVVAVEPAISWSAIFAGAFVMGASTLVLFTLAAGLGFSSVSPWPGSGVSATSFTIMTAAGLIIVQWVSSALGGYITGRLRTPWAHIHSHEVYFRDTAHGFLAWALATVVGALLMAMAATMAIGTATDAAATVASGAAQAAATAQPMQSGVDYRIDTLYRTDRADKVASPEVRAETQRIVATGLAGHDISGPDKAYLAQLVATNTGVTPADAQKRVDDLIASGKAAEREARQAADTARKAAAVTAIFTALSLMIGAFIGSAAAAFGGSLRDD